MQEANPCINREAISPRDLMLLAFIERYHSPGELAQQLHVPLPSVSHALKRLEQAGLVSRRSDEKDLRRFIFTITDEGQAAIERGKSCISKSFRERLARLNDAEKEELARLLVKLTEEEE